MKPACQATAFRWATLTLAAFSWLALSNHCALGLAMVENHGPKEVAAHDCCASPIPSHPPPARESSAPCCKTLPVVSLAPATAPPWNPFGVPGSSSDLQSMVLEPPAFRASFRLFLDTGPPNALSFAELVLQRSLLSHAPPFLS